VRYHFVGARALDAVRRAAQATPGEVEEILEEAAAEEAS
jgi:hypothetical protein